MNRAPFLIGTLFSCILLLLGIVALDSFGAGAHAQVNGSKELEERILSLQETGGDALEFDTLDLIADLPADDALRLYATLMDYYLGEGPGEILTEKATKAGDELIPLLVEKMRQPLPPRDKFEGRRPYLGIETRNQRIQAILDALKKGVVLYAAYPDDLYKEIDSYVKRIRVFVDDCYAANKELPGNLHLLRQYVWETYGYKLRIHDPWGRLIQYRIEDESNYVVAISLPDFVPSIHENSLDTQESEN